MMVRLRTLGTPLYLGTTGALTVLLSWLYYNLSLRSAGMKTTIFTTKQATPQFEISTFGPAHFYAGIAVDIVLAFLAAMLISLTIASYRAQRGVRGGAVGSTASLAVAVTTFG